MTHMTKDLSQMAQPLQFKRHCSLTKSITLICLCTRKVNSLCFKEHPPILADFSIWGKDETLGNGAKNPVGIK